MVYRMRGIIIVIKISYLFYGDMMRKEKVQRTKSMLSSYLIMDMNHPAVQDTRNE